MFQNLRRIEVRMVYMSASRASEALSRTGGSVDRSAFGARLRAVSSWNLDHLAAGPRELVAEHLDKSSPSSPSNVARQMGVLDHSLDVELFDDYSAVALGVSSRQLMQDMLALASRGTSASHGISARTWVRSLI